MSSKNSMMTDAAWCRVLLAVAAFGLMLFAGACGDSGNGNNNNNNNDNSPFPSTAKYESFCSEFKQCAPQVFSSAYSSVDGCASTFQTQYEFGLEAANISQSCQDALSSFYDCFFNSYQCSNGTWDQSSSCDSENNAIQQECAMTQ